MDNYKSSAVILADDTEKIMKSRDIIIDRIYNLLASKKELSADTFIGISHIMLKFYKYDVVEKDEDEDDEDTAHSDVI